MNLTVVSLDKQVEAIYQGYNFEHFSNLAETLGLSQNILGQYLDISSSTLDSRGQKKFSFQESNRMYELELVFKKALQVIGNSNDTQSWLKNKNSAIGESPLQLLKTAPGKEAVLLYLEQIARGVILWSYGELTINPLHQDFNMRFICKPYQFHFDGRIRELFKK